MGSHFHDWIDYNGGHIFNRVTRMGSQIFGFLGVIKKMGHVFSLGLKVSTNSS